MPQTIKTITSSGVNCYLVTTGESGFTLIDSGLSLGRTRLVKELENTGCLPGNLRLILITHADSDHTGNAAFLRREYGAKIALHPAEARAAQSGNLLDSRKSQTLLTRLIISLFKPPESDRFAPDLAVEDGQDLSAYGLKARVVHLPGHTAGSIGILTIQGDLFCGDMLMARKDGLRFGYGNPLDYKDSLEKLKNLEITTFYPGHGRPFSMEDFLRFYQTNRA